MSFARSATTGAAGSAVAGARVDRVLEVDLGGDLLACFGARNDENCFAHTLYLLSWLGVLIVEKPTASISCVYDNIIYKNTQYVNGVGLVREVLLLPCVFCI